jgi:hypothetical protein
MVVYEMQIHITFLILFKEMSFFEKFINVIRLEEETVLYKK